jgi:hypothetical protein
MKYYLILNISSKYKYFIKAINTTIHKYLSEKINIEKYFIKDNDNDDNDTLEFIYIIDYDNDYNHLNDFINIFFEKYILHIKNIYPEYGNDWNINYNVKINNN